MEIRGSRSSFGDCIAEYSSEICGEAESIRMVCGIFIEGRAFVSMVKELKNIINE